MKTPRFVCSHSSLNFLGLALVFSLALGAAPLSAASLFTLAGTTNDARYEDENHLKLSVIDWSQQEAREAVLKAYSAYRESGDEEAFLTVLNEQQTRGYLFTGEVTGYSIKYAQPLSDNDMALLIVPGLKSKDRYMWDPERPEGAPDFTLLEVMWQGEKAEVLTSLGSEITFDENEGLSLPEDAPVFGTVEDDTPYYMKENA